METLWLSIWFCCFALGVHFQTASCVNSSSEVEPISCPFSGKRFPVGETWYRVLPTPEATFCVTCHCNQSGKSICDSRSCTRGAKNSCEDALQLDPLEKECCQECEEMETEQLKVRVFESPEAEPRAEERERSQEAEEGLDVCTHNGRLYADGQVFASNSTGLKVTSANQCIQCVCKVKDSFQTGLVLCRIKTCFMEDCSALSSPSRAGDHSADGDCCRNINCRVKADQLVGDEEDHGNKFHLVTFLGSDEDPGSLELQPYSCKSGGRVYPNGAQWHPIIGPFGQMECVICRCQASSVECSRVECPPLDKAKCIQPKRAPGQCCPSCPGSEDFADSEEMKPVPKSGPESRSTGPASLCLPLRMDTVVYRSQASSSISGYYQYAFRANSSLTTVLVYSWTIKEGRVEHMTLQHLTPDEYQRLMGSFRFKLLGATKTRFTERFSKRAKKLLQRCSHRCIQKIERLEKSLRLKEVVGDRACLKNETTFH